MKTNFPNNASPNYFIEGDTINLFGLPFWTFIYRAILFILLFTIAICWWIEGMDIPHKIQTTYVIHKYDPVTDKMLNQKIIDESGKQISSHYLSYYHKKKPAKR